MDVTVREERMSGAMTKYHVGLDGELYHRFTGPDQGDPHDHPWGFTSMVICGGYLEEVYSPGQENVELIWRLPWQPFEIKATHIHRIIETIGETITRVWPGPWERKSGFWQFHDDGCYFREWDQPEFMRVDT